MYAYIGQNQKGKTKTVLGWGYLRDFKDLNTLYGFKKLKQLKKKHI